MKKPTIVSAIITTHNRKVLLRKAIDSVLKQTYKSMECIVVDDAGTDNTKEYLKDYIDSKKIKYIYIPKEESKGGNYARNKGIEASRGSYIAFLDDDDEWMSNKIRMQMNLVSDKVGFVYTGRIIEKNLNKRYDESISMNYLEGDLSKEILIHILTVTSTILVRKDILVNAGLFDENLRYWQEYDLCIRVLQETKAMCVKKGLVLYRIISSDKGRLSNNISGWEESVKYINHKYKTLFEKLTRSERSKRLLYICIDGVNRGKKIRSLKTVVKYGCLYPLTHPGVIVEFLKKIIVYTKRKTSSVRK